MRRQSETKGTRGTTLKLNEAHARRLHAFWKGGATSLLLPARATLVIGRSPSADIFVDHASVSRTHAELLVGDDVRVKDLESSNGTKVGGRAIEPHTEVVVGTGTLIEVGSAVLVLQTGVARDSSALDAPLSSGRVLPKGDLDSVMTKLEEIVLRVAASPISVILLGETGVGKEVAAESIWKASLRRDKGFVKLNCAALPESLLEAELFGYERGAFTGAVSAKPGLLEVAHGGTVFLDEVAELSPATQAKLLRVLENGEVLRLGSVKSAIVDVRVIAATHRDLEAMVVAGEFRADLFYRLNGIALEIPPLRERREEIPELARLFLRRAGEKSGRPSLTLSDSALERLAAHPYPGNVRELRNVVERAVVLCSDEVVTAEHIVFSTLGGARAPDSSAAPNRSGDLSLRGEIDDFEKQRILSALDRCGGNQTYAARELGISRRTLISRLHEYGRIRPRPKKK